MTDNLRSLHGRLIVQANDDGTATYSCWRWHDFNYTAGKHGMTASIAHTLLDHYRDAHGKNLQIGEAS